jgi:hypothetical protein
MLKDKTPSQGEMEIIYIEDLVSKNHIEIEENQKVHRFRLHTRVNKRADGQGQVPGHTAACLGR